MELDKQRQPTVRPARLDCPKDREKWQGTRQGSDIVCLLGLQDDPTGLLEDTGLLGVDHDDRDGFQ
jgi:hypothetical protein